MFKEKLESGVPASVVLGTSLPCWGRGPDRYAPIPPLRVGGAKPPSPLDSVPVSLPPTPRGSLRTSRGWLTDSVARGDSDVAGFAARASGCEAHAARRRRWFFHFTWRGRGGRLRAWVFSPACLVGHNASPSSRSALPLVLERLTGTRPSVA